MFNCLFASRNYSVSISVGLQLTLTKTIRIFLQFLEGYASEFIFATPVPFQVLSPCCLSLNSHFICLCIATAAVRAFFVTCETFYYDGLAEQRSVRSGSSLAVKYIIMRQPSLVACVNQLQLINGQCNREGSVKGDVGTFPTNIDIKYTLHL